MAKLKRKRARKLLEKLVTNETFISSFIGYEGTGDQVAKSVFREITQEAKDIIGHQGEC